MIKNRKSVYFLFIIGFLLIMVTFNNFYSRKIETKDLKSINILTTQKILEVNEKKMFFLIRMEDFSCQMCFNSFMRATEYVSKRYDRFGNTIVYIIESDSRPFDIQRVGVRKWAKINSILYETYIASNFHELWFFKKSCVLVKDENSFVQYEFPLSESLFKSFKINANQ